MLKKLIKKLFIFIAYPRKFQERVVIASSGRAGSSMLYEAVALSFVAGRFGLGRDTWLARWLAKLSAEFVDRIDEVGKEPYPVCKTHDMYRGPMPPEFKVVFVYGDPLDSAASVQQVVARQGLAWFREHQRHLGAKGSFDDLFRQDVLNYQGQITSWLAQADANVICIDYEDLWLEQARLSAFLGFDVWLPPREERRRKTLPAEMNAILFADLRALRDAMRRSYLVRVEAVRIGVGSRGSAP